MANDVEMILKFVLERSEEMSIQQDPLNDSENFLSELLTHVDLLRQTVQCLYEIGKIPTLNAEDLKNGRI